MFKHREFLIWWLILMVALIALVLGSMGIAQYLVANGKQASAADALYRAIQLFTFNFYDAGPLPWQLELARWLAPTATFGALLKSLAFVWSAHKAQWRLSGMTGHVVYGGKKLGQQLGQQNRKLVLAELNDARPPVLLPNGQIKVSAPTMDALLKESQASNAGAIMVRADSFDEGLAWLQATFELCQANNRQGLDVTVVLPERTACLRLAALSERMEPYLQTRCTRDIDLLTSKACQAIAQNWLKTSVAPIPVLTLMGSAPLCLEISRRLCVMLEVRKDAPIKICIATFNASVSDLAAFDFIVSSAPQLIWEQRSLTSWSDSKLLWQDASMVCLCAEQSDDFFDALEVRSTTPEAHSLPTIALVFTHWLSGKACHALAANKDTEQLFLISLKPAEEVTAAQISPEIERTAQSIHAHYLATSTSTGPAALPWEQLPERYRQSSRLQAESLQFKLLCLGFSLESVPADVTTLATNIESRIELLAEAEHQRWMTEKKLQGWTYGVPRDDRLKHHPCLLPYAELPEVEQEKDREMWRLLTVK
jgi:hypothetical protein